MKEPSRRTGEARGRAQGPSRTGGEALRGLPQVEKVLRNESVGSLIGPYPRSEVVRAVREVLGEIRSRLLEPGAGSGEDEARKLRVEAIPDEVRLRLERRGRSAYRRAV